MLEAEIQKQNKQSVKQETICNSFSPFLLLYQRGRIRSTRNITYVTTMWWATIDDRVHSVTDTLSGVVENNWQRNPIIITIHNKSVLWKHLCLPPI